MVFEQTLGGRREWELVRKTSGMEPLLKEKNSLYKAT
jgi:hypothetical protein